MNTTRVDVRQAVSLGLIAAICLAVASWAFFDIWVDISEESIPLWSVLLENIFPLSFAFGVPFLTWRLRNAYSSSHLWKIARWTAAGFGGALLLSGVVIGIQSLQTGLRPRVLLIQTAAFGAAAGLFIGVVISRLARVNESLQAEVKQRKAAEEELSSRIEESQRKNAILGLIKDVSSAANEAESVEESLQEAVDAVCTRVGWPVGHIFLRTDEDEPGDDELRASGIWNRGSDGRFEAFKKETEQLSFARGEGLPGQVLRNGEAAWIEDVRDHSILAQQQAALDVGIKGTFAFPVWANGEVAAVLEFYSETREPLDGELLSAMETVGLQLGRVIERQKDHTKLRRLNENLEERAQERAQEVYWERERLRSLLDSIPDEVWFCNENGDVPLVNAAVADKFGFDGNDDLPRPLAEVLGELDIYRGDGSPRPVEESPLYRSLDGEVVKAEEEVVFCSKTGNMRHRQVNAAPLRGSAGEITGSVAVVHDITELKQTEEELRRRERDFTALANNIPQLAWMANPDGHIFWYNDRWYEYTGTTFEEMEGWGWTKVHHPDHRDEVVEQYEEALAAEEPFEDTFPLQSGNGRYRWFLTRAMPIRDDDGNVVRWFGTNTDITDRLRLEDQLKALNENLEERVQERTQQVRELASELTMAEQRERRRIARLLHDDLQQKLYGIQLKLSFILNSPPQGQHGILEQIESLDERLEEAIQMIRQISVGMSPPVLESDGLTGALEWLQSHVQKRYGLEVDLTATREFREIDRDLRVLLFRIVQELLSNVAEHTNVEKAEVKMEDGDGLLRIHVRDDGDGFDLETVAQADSQETFGLTIARERIRFFEGDLTIESAPGEGTRATVKVPIKKISASDRGERPEETPPDDKGRDARS